MDETDILRMARDLIDEFSQGAPAEATERAGALLDIEDMEGRAVWLRVSEAAKVLLKKEARGNPSLAGFRASRVSPNG